MLCECVLAEIRPAFAPGEIDEFLADWAIEFVASTRGARNRVPFVR